MRIGVLGNVDSWYVNQIIATADSRGHTPVELRFNEQNPRIRNGETQLWIGQEKATDLDVLLVRTMPPGSLEQVVSRMDFLAAVEHAGVRIINSPKSIECAVDKYLTTQKLAQNGIPVPDTILCETSEIAAEAFELLGGDVVVKPLFGAEGRGILRIDHPEMALRAFRTLERLGAAIYLQRFNRGPLEDIRILVLDGQVVASMKRRPAPGDFRANVAQAGIAEKWSPTNREVSLAIHAASVTDCIFCGVDLMYNASGSPVVIEVNAVPGWRALEKTCKINVLERLFGWIENTSRHSD